MQGEMGDPREKTRRPAASSGGKLLVENLTEVLPTNLLTNLRTKSIPTHTLVLFTCFVSVFSHTELASHRGEPCSIPGGVTPVFSQWETCRAMPLVRGIPQESPVPPTLHSGAAPYSPHSSSSALKTSLLRAAQISSLTHSYIETREFRGYVWQQATLHSPFERHISLVIELRRVQYRPKIIYTRAMCTIVYTGSGWVNMPLNQLAEFSGLFSWREKYRLAGWPNGMRSVLVPGARDRLRNQDTAARTTKPHSATLFPPGGAAVAEWLDFLRHIKANRVQFPTRKGRGKREIPEKKPADQRHRPARFPLAKVRRPACGTFAGCKTSVKTQVKAVNDKVDTLEINLRKKSLLPPAYVSTGAPSDMRPVKLITSRAKRRAFQDRFIEVFDVAAHRESRGEIFPTCTSLTSEVSSLQRLGEPRAWNATAYRILHLSSIKCLFTQPLPQYSFRLMQTKLNQIVATVAEWLACFPSTKANQVESPAGSPDFRKWESCRTMTLVGGFSRGPSVSTALSFRRRFIPTLITLIDSQDLAVKSHPNLFTHLNKSRKLHQRDKALHSYSISVQSWSPSEVAQWLNFELALRADLRSNPGLAILISVPHGSPIFLQKQGGNHSGRLHNLQCSTDAVVVDARGGCVDDSRNVAERENGAAKRAPPLLAAAVASEIHQLHGKGGGGSSNNTLPVEQEARVDRPTYLLQHCLNVAPLPRLLSLVFVFCGPPSPFTIPTPSQNHNPPMPTFPTPPSPFFCRLNVMSLARLVTYRSPLRVWTTWRIPAQNCLQAALRGIPSLKAKSVHKVEAFHDKVSTFEITLRKKRTIIVNTVACANRAGRCCWSEGFLEDFPFPLPLNSGASPYPPRFTVIDSQDLD
ncbi:hypothetical protein PR048_017684, partial [Dryococelus australis]